jgi:hypothetical protein
VNTTKAASAAALVLVSALPLAARADPGDQGLMRRGYYGPAPDPYYRRPQARQGLLLSFGAGGGSLYLSNEGPGRIGVADFDFRIGYGFSDRFQMFMDFNAADGHNAYGDQVGSWTWTLRAQTLLAGDRAGNGLNLNFGAGFGGLTYDSASVDRASPTGFALAGGLSYDARIAPNFSLSPEFFVTWHQVPNLPGIPDDVSSMYGVRLNLLWYLH